MFIIQQQRYGMMFLRSTLFFAISYVYLINVLI